MMSRTRPFWEEVRDLFIFLFWLTILLAIPFAIYLVFDLLHATATHLYHRPDYVWPGY